MPVKGEYLLSTSFENGIEVTREVSLVGALSSSNLVVEESFKPDG
jgi:hypothetical protein